MAYRQLSQLDFSVKAAAGACLVQAQNVVGAGGGPYSATVAANATRFRHTGGKLPRDAAVVVWFDHWGTYQDYRNGEFRYENWGHVVIWWPKAFNGAGGYYSSPRAGYGGEWFRTIADIEREFNSKYRFWSEDINGVRVSAPAPTAAAKPTTASKTTTLPEEEDMLINLRGKTGSHQAGLYLFKNGKATRLGAQQSAFQTLSDLDVIGNLLKQYKLG